MTVSININFCTVNICFLNYLGRECTIVMVLTFVEPVDMQTNILNFRDKLQIPDILYVLYTMCAYWLTDMF